MTAQHRRKAQVRAYRITNTARYDPRLSSHAVPSCKA